MLWPVRIHAQPPWRGEHPLRGLYSPMDPRSNCASGRTAGQDGSNMQGIGRPSKGLIAFFVCGHARTSRISFRAVARTAATLKKVEPRVGTRNVQCEKRWFSTSA